MTLQTRKPTGQVAYPLVLVEGDEKAGKSFALAQFSASPRVGRCFNLDLGDGTMDEYARLGDYEILVHNGTWSSIITQVRAAAAEPSDPERPNVIGIDTGSQVWALLKSWTDARARRSKKGQEVLQADPDAEIDPAMNLWNDAIDRWNLMLSILKEFPGIGVILADGREVVKVENGAPTKETTWSVDVQKGTQARVSAWVRMRRDETPRAKLIGVRSLDVVIPPGGLALPESGMLDHLVFDVIGAGRSFGTSTAVKGQVEMPTVEAMNRVLEAVRKHADGKLTEDETKAEAGRRWREAGLPSAKESPEVDAAAVTALIEAIWAPPGDDGPLEGGGQEAATPPQEPQDEPEPETAPEGPADPPEPTEEPYPVDKNRVQGNPVEKCLRMVWLGMGGTTGENPDPAVDPNVYIQAIDKLTKPSLVGYLRQMELPTSGTNPEQADRLKAALGLPLEQLPPEAPDGYDLETCACGRPMAVSQTNAMDAFHLDRRFDADHDPVPPF